MTVDQGRFRRFTLVEILIAFAALQVLAVVAIPWVRSAREASRAAQCRDNLKQLVVGMHGFAGTNPNEAYSTGAWDYRQSGCLTEYGWVADLANLDLAQPGRALCPENSIRTSAAIEGGYRSNPADAIPGIDVARLTAGRCGDVAFGAARSPERAAFLGQRVLGVGLNTNYAASWHLAWTMPRVYLAGEDSRRFVWRNDPSGPPVIDPFGVGPLTARMAENGIVARNLIAMLGDGGNAGGQDGTLEADIEVRDALRGLRGRLDEGSPTATTVGAGPSFVSDGDIVSAEAMAQTTDIDIERYYAAMARELAVVDPTGPNGNGMFLQDYRHWYAVHGGSLNVAMADGSVSTFRDRSGDWFVDPGFHMPNTEKEDRATAVEASAERIFSGVYPQTRGPCLE